MSTTALTILLVSGDINIWGVAIAQIGRDLQIAGFHLALEVKLEFISGWTGCSDEIGEADLIVFGLESAKALAMMSDTQRSVSVPFISLLSEQVTLDEMPHHMDWSMFLVGVRRLPISDIDALGMLTEYLMWNGLDHED